MGNASLRNAAAAAVAAVSLAAFAGCGTFDGRPSTSAVNADIKTQVEQVCREVGGQLKTLPASSDRAAQEKGQRQSEQIFRTAVGKLREQEVTGGLTDSYKSWLDAFEQLPALNEQAAKAADTGGSSSESFTTASDRWAAQAEKANGLAREAGLDNCVVADGQSG